MKKLILLISLVALVGCTGKETPVCQVGKVISETVAKEVAVQLDCKNEQAIVDSLFKQLESWKVCEPSMQSVIGDLICPRLVDSLVNGTFKQIPASWGCSGGSLKDTAKDQLTALCRKSI